ncbi:hypothetical protein [Desulfoluna sp.]|uniref:hypothetical protein n=1 Tax=Desulfoluna sp. TaxID=2045199 RepID=UPI002639BDF2|nr:hypothetical protein [Desulfoluna sp.]
MSVFLDERNNKRMHIPGTIQYSRSPTGDYRDADLLNCTDRGLCFQSKCPYLPETSLVIRSKNRKNPYRQFAKVVWSRPMSPTTRENPAYRVGVIFIS